MVGEPRGRRKEDKPGRRVLTDKGVSGHVSGSVWLHYVRCGHACARVYVYIGRGHREESVVCRAGQLHEGRAVFGFSAARLRLRNDRMRRVP